MVGLLLRFKNSVLRASVLNFDETLLIQLLSYILKSTTFFYNRPLEEELIFKNIRAFTVDRKLSRIYLLLRPNRGQLRKIQQVSATLWQESTSCWLPGYCFGLSFLSISFAQQRQVKYYRNSPTTGTRDITAFCQCFYVGNHVITN